MGRSKKLNPDEIRKMRFEFHENILQGRLSIAEAARKMRLIVGMTQVDYAKFLNIGERTYIDIERGVGNPTYEVLQKIGKPFNLNVVFFHKI